MIIPPFDDGLISSSIVYKKSECLLSIKVKINKELTGSDGRLDSFKFTLRLTIVAFDVIFELAFFSFFNPDLNFTVSLVVL